MKTYNTVTLTNDEKAILVKAEHLLMGYCKLLKCEECPMLAPPNRTCCLGIAADVIRKILDSCPIESN